MLQFGCEVLASQAYAPLRGQRVGLLTNPSAVDRALVSTYQRFVATDAVNLVALYGAEHGAFGQVEAGEHVATAHDARTGVPVYSLYGQSYRPSPEMLRDIDVMVCEIQDIGVRYYTYLWTMTHVLEACGEAEVPVIVLDRPNPLGDAVAGRGLDPALASLVGRYNIPIQHGMTVGELLQMHNALWNPTPAELSVIPCEAYQRAQTWAELGRPFVPTSPNIPHMGTVQQYPGACLIEGTTLSEGRGTTTPFEIVGAPYINARDLATALSNLQLPGVAFRPHHFTPLMSKHAGEACAGMQVHLLDQQADLLQIWLHVIHTVRALYPDDFGWRPPFAEGEAPIFDKLIGSAQPRQMLDDGASVADVMAGWDVLAERFRQARAPYLIYG